ncbi:HAMP domain-containing histidine kinase [Shewanella corallii]|uniref:histidine kinase n=1 Tax=Shewanella corallii TaxID=560080 RepID=A0ABT0N7N1_9GAMM|nr:HAMP domain-containing histidine kinase [Shewanella corallii]
MKRLNSSAQTLTLKLIIYFTSVAMLVGFLTGWLIVALNFWLEDEINLRNLKAMEPYVIEQYRQGAKFPLSFGPDSIAYVDSMQVPPEYSLIIGYPLGFVGELIDIDDPEIFFTRSEFEYKGHIHQLYLTKKADPVELTRQEWHKLLAFLLAVIALTIALQIFGIFRLSKRLIQPVFQLSNQLKMGKEQEFKVPPGAVMEFQLLADSINHYREANQKLLKQEQAFARYASHELRTPLTVIQGAVKLLECNQDEVFQQKQRHRIKRSADDMQNMIDALLSLVKHEKLQKTNVRELVADEVQQIMEPLQARAETRQLTMKLDFPEPIKVTPEPAVLRILLNNLLNNAINASEQGEIQIRISKGEIRVQDPGSNPDKHEDNQSGHGLGLLIVDSLCHRYGWQFELISQSGAGSEAVLSFK